MQQSQPAQISCLLLPVQDRHLLLPNASVAEIIDYRAPEHRDSYPEWFLGYLSWRGLKIPMVSYDAANQQALGKRGEHARIAVTNTIGQHHEKLPFVAFLTQGLPRLMKVTKEEIVENSELETGPADQMAIKVSGEEAYIPNLEHLESLAMEALTTL